MCESNANEQLDENMECQSSEPFDMGNSHLKNSARVASGPPRRLRVHLWHTFKVFQQHIDYTLKTTVL